jgi:hypothetical protein
MRLVFHGFQLVSNFRARFETYDKLYSNLSPSSIHHVFESKMLGALKHRDEFGRKIVYFRIRKTSKSINIKNKFYVFFIFYGIYISPSFRRKLGLGKMFCRRYNDCLHYLCGGTSQFERDSVERNRIDL